MNEITAIFKENSIDILRRVLLKYRGFVMLEDYPSPAEGNGLENRQASNIARGFESHILLKERELNSMKY